MLQPEKSRQTLLDEIDTLRGGLADAEETLRAIRAHEVDAFVVARPAGNEIVTLAGADYPYREMVEYMSEGAATLIPDGTIFYSNPCFIEMTRTTAGQLTGTPFSQWFAAPQHAALAALLQAASAAPVRGEFLLRAADTTGVPVQLSAHRLKLGMLNGISVVVTDISDRKRAEASIRQSQTALEAAQALAHLGSWSMEAQTGVIRWSDEMFRLHYLKPAATPPALEDYIASVHPDDRQAVTNSLNALTTTPDQTSYQFRTNPAHGPERFLEMQLHIVKDEAGQVTAWQGTMLDITQRKQRERELEGVNRVSAALRTSKTLDEMLPLLLKETVEVLDGSAGSLWLYEAASDEVRIAYKQGWGKVATAYKRGEGVPGYVLATGQPYVSRELKTDPRMPEAIRPLIPAGRGGACVPIRHEDLIIGALYINVELPREFSAADVRLLTTLAEMAGSAYHRMQLFEQTEQRLRHLSALRTIDQAISGSLDLTLTLQVLLDEVISQLGVDAAVVRLVTPHTQALDYAAGRGFWATAGERLSLRHGAGLAGRVAAERRTLALPDLALDNPDPARTAVLTAEGFQAYYGVPLIAKGTVQGVLEIFQRTPLHPDAEWLDFLEALAGLAAIAIENTQLFTNLQRSNRDLSLAYDATIEGWSRALDLRDKETEGHSLRVTERVLRLARAFGLRAAEIAQIRWGALLHDIGKMGVPDRILLKPGPLSDDEWVIMRLHPTLAHQMLSPIHYLTAALDIPYCHHEKWDGTGYPRGLSGEQIPLAARLFTVIDVWDALTSERPYRPAWPAAKVREHIHALAGTHFDPRVVATFEALQTAEAVEAGAQLA